MSASFQAETLSFEAVRQALLQGDEIALLDVREEHPYAQAHPLWAANFPLSRLELEAWLRIPRRDTRIVVYGHDESGDLAPRALTVLRRLGYTQTYALDGGLEGWQAKGGEVFRDVNVPSKSFGELVEHERHTPSLSAPEVLQQINGPRPPVIVDARRYDEYHTMSIPTATSLPGAELVLRIRELAPDPDTPVIVNCAGRTRSIIGTQSLINAGLPNPVAALRNGTIGWTLADQQLDHGASRQAPPPSAAHIEQARQAAGAVADKAGVKRIAWEDIDTLQVEGRTLYRLDVRTPQEHAQGLFDGFSPAPGGQLVQETDHHAPVRGARILLADDDGVRAPMSASWLAQMGWEVYVTQAPAQALKTTGWQAPAPVAPDVPSIDAAELAQWLQSEDPPLIVDVTSSANYVRAHIPGAHFVIRAQLAQALRQLLPARRYVFTCQTNRLAPWAAADAAAWLQGEVRVLAGGTTAWIDAGLATESGETRLASPRVDRYRRPYEGTDASAQAKQAYLDWEFGLVEQLGRDGTHGFHVI